jgi:hypothetical protein
VRNHLTRRRWRSGSARDFRSADRLKNISVAPSQSIRRRNRRMRNRTTSTLDKTVIVIGVARFRLSMHACCQAREARVFRASAWDELRVVNGRQHMSPRSYNGSL